MLIDLARETVEAEKESQIKPTADKKKALSRIFEKAKTKRTPKEIEEVVKEIDEIIEKLRFDGWDNTIQGTRDIKQALFKILYRHKLSDDEELFEKAYNYIKEHY